MSREVIFSIFAEEEGGGYLKWRNFRDKVSRPFCDFFHKHGITHNHLSYLGLAMVIPFIYFFGFNPWLSYIFILLNLFFDSLDGPMARFSGKASTRGAVVDIMFDHLSFFIIFLTFLYFGLLNPFWGSVYLVNYVIMLAFIIFCRGLRIKFFPVIRSKYYVYMVFFIWLMTGQNYFDPFLVCFSFYMFATNFFLFDRIKCSLP